MTYLVNFCFNLVYIIYISNIFYILDAQGYWYILARKNSYISNILFNKYVFANLSVTIECEINNIKSVILIKLNKRLRLHHFNKLVGGNKYNNIFSYIDFCLIDKYLYLIFNLF